MRLWPTLYRIGARFCLACFGRLLLWSLWLGLCILLGLSTWIACSPHLDLPKPLLRKLEQRLALEGLEVHVGGVVFSTTGQLLLSDLRVHLADFEDPFLIVEKAQTTISPWALFSGSQRAHQLDFSGAYLILPAQISPSGTAQPLLEDIDGSLAYGNHRLEITHLNARCAGLDLRVSGALDDSSLRPSKASNRPFGPELVAALRRAAALYPQVLALGKGWLEISLQADTRAIALARLEGGLNELRLEKPVPIEAGPLGLHCSPIPLRSAAPFPLTLHATLAHLSSPKASIDSLLARLELTIDPRGGTATEILQAHSLELSAAQVSNPWIPLEGTSLVLTPGASTRSPTKSPPAPSRTEPVKGQPPASTATRSLKEWIPSGVNADIALTAAGNLNGLQGQARLPELSAELDFRSEIDSGLVLAIGKIIGRDILRFVNFRQKGSVDGHLSLAPAGRLRFVEGIASADSLEHYKVSVSHVSGHVRFDGTELLADRALVRMGKDFARGSYGMNVRNRDFRILISGQVRPDRINPWFKGWWPGFWENFDFTQASPVTDIDIGGRWGVIPRMEVMVGVDARKATLRGIPFDRARARLYIRPSFVHAMNIEAWRPEGSVSGWFSRFYDTESGLWTRIDFDASGSIDPQAAASLHTPATQALASNFVFEKTPTAHVSGWLEGPGAPKGLAHHIDFTASSTGKFTLFRFPLSDVSCTGVWDGPEIRLPKVNAKAAGGHLNGSARFDTEGTAHRITFAGSLTEARLGEALDDVESHVALLAGTQHQRTPDRLAGTLVTLYASASGSYDSPFSFHGTGNAHIWGEELAKVRLLGGLSQLLSFTSLRFTSAKAKFQLEGPKVQFPTIRLIGHNSAIDAYGSFHLDTKAISFNAKVWPFDQTPGLIQSAMGLVLSPLSHALEVKLSGTLSAPSWAFLYNPFRALSATAQEPVPATSEPTLPVPPTTPFK